MPPTAKKPHPKMLILLQTLLLGLYLNPGWIPGSFQWEGKRGCTQARTCSGSSWDKSPAFRSQINGDLHSWKISDPNPTLNFLRRNGQMFKCDVSGEYWEAENSSYRNSSLRFSYSLPMSSMIFWLLNRHQVRPFGCHHIGGKEQRGTWSSAVPGVQLWAISCLK